MREKLATLIESVWSANIKLKESGLVLLTFGNLSAIDRDQSIVAIKPSGVPYEELSREDIVLCDMAGTSVASKLRPSSDLPTHLALYRAFPGIGAVVHTHSSFATAFAQARRSLPCLGTTHADFFRGEVPVTDPMSAEDMKAKYEANTGMMIIRKFRESGIGPDECPAVLVAGHGPFCWGASASDALENAVALEEVCRTASLSLALTDRPYPLDPALVDRHFFRKHGENSYYGQKKS